MNNSSVLWSSNIYIYMLDGVILALAARVPQSGVFESPPGDECLGLQGIDFLY